MADAVHIPAIPAALEWHTAPQRWARTETGGLRIEAGARTDLFVDPLGSAESLNAPRLLAALPGDFQFSARVAVDFGETYDAGVLLLWVDYYSWAKLCFERSPDGDPMVVSVVTRGVSDDSNAFVVKDDHVWLRVSRLGRAYAFHASTDGTTWQFVRYFSLGDHGKAQIGLEAQSPMGPGCRVTFESLAYTPKRLAELRDGS